MQGQPPRSEGDELCEFQAGEVTQFLGVGNAGEDVFRSKDRAIVAKVRGNLRLNPRVPGAELRVGRGERKSYCVLVSDQEKERLDVFAKTRDGFEVAERDLEARGPGEFLGTRQSGALRFRFGNILRDFELMEKARDAAIKVLEREGLDGATDVVRRLLGIEQPAAKTRD